MKKQVYIGELNKRVSIVEEHSTKSSTGQAVVSQSTLKSCYAKQIEKSANEEEEGKIRFLYTTEFIVRYDARLTKGKAASMLVKDEDDLLYEIIGVVEKVPKRYLQINSVRRG